MDDELKALSGWADGTSIEMQLRGACYLLSRVWEALGEDNQELSEACDSASAALDKLRGG